MKIINDQPPEQPKTTTHDNKTSKDIKDTTNNKDNFNINKQVVHIREEVEKEEMLFPKVASYRGITERRGVIPR